MKLLEGMGVELRTGHFDHCAKGGFQRVSVDGRRGVGLPRELLPEGCRHGVRREPCPRTIGARNPHALWQRLRRQRADHESRREQRCQRDLAFATERRTANEGRERPEAKARRREGVRGKVQHAENLNRDAHCSNERFQAEVLLVRCRGRPAGR